NVLNAPATTLRNRGTGPGRVTAMLVVVEISGKEGAFAPQRKLVFLARDPRRVLLKRSADVGIISENGRYYLAFWLYDIGCYPVTLTAHLLGQPSSSAVRNSVDFTCGD